MEISTVSMWSSLQIPKVDKGQSWGMKFTWKFFGKRGWQATGRIDVSMELHHRDVENEGGWIELCLYLLSLRVETKP